MSILRKSTDKKVHPTKLDGQECPSYQDRRTPMSVLLPMPNNAIVLVIDRLQPAYLGPYGNNSVPTPAWNALAAESLLLENQLTDTTDLVSVYRAWWSGANGVSDQPSLALSESLENASIHTALITDDPSLLEHSHAERFAERIVVRHEDNAREAAEPTESRLAAVLEAALAWLEDSPPEPFLLWVHACGMAGPWDAPYDMRLAMADDEDPDPPRFLDPPEYALPTDHDPEDLLGLTQAYAGQVMLTDMCLGMFLEGLVDAGHDHTLLACTSPRGYPLGEHGIVGACREVLTFEATHVPLVIRSPDREAAAVREQSLTHAADLHATLCDWFELPAEKQSSLQQSLLPLINGQLPVTRERQILNASDRVGIRTPQWLLTADRKDLESQGTEAEIFLDRQTTQLYAKPDDRHEFNNVFDLCQREANELAAELRNRLSQPH